MKIKTISKEVYDDLLQVLREADADLAGMQGRWHRGQFEVAADRKAATETREHIAAVYVALTGHDPKGDSSDNT